MVKKIEQSLTVNTVIYHEDEDQMVDGVPHLYEIYLDKECENDPNMAINNRYVELPLQIIKFQKGSIAVEGYNGISTLDLLVILKNRVANEIRTSKKNLPLRARILSNINDAIEAAKLTSL